MDPTDRSRPLQALAGCCCGRARKRAASKGARIMSNEFKNLDVREKAAVEAALNRCRALAGQIESELRNKRPKHLLDKALLAFAPLLSTLSMSWDRKADSRSRIHLLPWRRVRRGGTVSDKWERSLSSRALAGFREQKLQTPATLARPAAPRSGAARRR